LVLGTLEQARSLNRTIQGGKKKATAAPGEGKAVLKTISASHHSFTQQTDNFGILLQLLATIPAYNPKKKNCS